VKNQFIRTGLTSIAVGVALLACSESPTSLPDNGVDDAMVGSLMSQLAAGGSATASSVASGGSTAAPSDTTSRDPRACLYNTTTKFFVCPARTLPNGMTDSTSFQLLDAANNPLPRFDTLVVAFRRVSRLNGTLNQPIQTQNGPVAATQSITQNDDMTITGFRTNTPEQNGTGTMTNTIVPVGMPTGTVSVSKTVAGLKFDPSPTGPRYPTAGTITAQITNQQGSGPQFTSTQVTTYDGTSIAKTVITTPNGPTRTCTYDMAANPPVPPTCTTS